VSDGAVDQGLGGDYLVGGVRGELGRDRV